MDPILEEKKELLRTEWENYVHHEIDSEDTKAVILESWERCNRSGMPVDNDYPLRVIKEAELQRLREKNRELIEISQPIRSRIRDFIQGSHFVIALTDAHGVLLEITGDSRMRQSVVGGGFIEGADWSEQSAGSNAIGTALAIDRPMQFAGYEHFCAFTQKTACAAAPIHDPDGHIIGSIDLTGRLRDVTQHTLGIVVAMASDIENCLRISRAQKAIHLENAYKDIMLESMTQGVIALNEREEITHLNLAARKILHLSGSYIGKNARRLLAVHNQPLLDLLDTDPQQTDREFRIRTAQQTIRVTGSSRSIEDDRRHRLGTIFIFDEIRRTQRIAARYAGATAHLTFDDMIVHDAHFRSVVTLARSAAKSDASMLLLGESGTGKDIMAQAIHNASSRRNHPYVAINCGAIPRELIASELFGYAEGAYTGARRGGNAGKFEMADGGTIFLDEIGEMSLDLQVHLLRVLENRSVTRIGSAETIPVDVRIIAATNTDLIQAIQDGLFRRDLYYRLNVISLYLPPLRERTADIPPLIRHFASQYLNEEPVVPKDFENLLCRYDWPGNIRELRNIIERTISLSPDRQLHSDYLPADFFSPALPRRNSASAFGQNGFTPSISGSPSLSTVEKDALLERLRETHGNIARTARELGVARTTIYRKLKQYHLGPDSFHPAKEDT